ncbi:cellulose-growth-specific protein [Corynespora cassiicola Philippines]|uniref:lytic cellulose monooxygenase (C4-dehydrogenating) n=1 Tax=Corynespora cassiicola Philippines TaxID=1448308 RepID=A0A2T2NZ71_CORCC|nr:cellulose-growth-specific protein [Corynespora cassiicola Philippines]
MKFTTSLFAISALASTALAHWNYDRLIHNGKIVGDYYTYIRRTSNSNSPVTDVASNDMRCNVGGASGANTQTYTVAAGDEIGFVINVNFGHPGPQQVYISKAPSAAKDYDGSGSWTKIYSLTTKAITDQGLQWAGDGMTSFLFKIPAETPAGEYLVRAEGLALHGAGTVGGAQWYIGCAQIKVTGSGSGSLSPSVKIPGVYKGDEPGIKINIYYPPPTSYTTPGPALWPAGTQEQHAAKQL